jgi:hypothetical protein
MVSPVKTERRWSGGYLVSEGNGEQSRDQVTLKQQAGGTILDAGTILGLISASAAAPVYAAQAGNTGTFTSSAVVNNGAQVGVYRIEFIAPTVFMVYDPAGNFLGEGNTGVAFNAGGVQFTLTAGGVAAVAGDGGTITVAANADAGKYTPVNLAAVDGSQNAAAILYNSPFDVTAADTKQTVTKRLSEVNGSELTYPAGANAGQIAALNAQLGALGIIVR